MKYALSALVAFFLSVPVWSQTFAFQIWHEGKIVLESGDTLKGDVKYNLQNDLLQFKVQNTTIQTYTARNTLYFEIFDLSVKRYRQFYSLPFALAGRYKAPVFFELLEEGKITLLSRESLEYRTYNSGFYYYGTYTRLVMVDKYFLLDEKGEIIPFQGAKKNDWLDLMPKHEEDVQKYVRENRLDLGDKYDVARMVAYYNSFFK